MTTLPDQGMQQPATTAGQPYPRRADRAQAQQLIDAVNEALSQPTPTSYRDTSPIPSVGTTPPVPQPGRPPMSQRATDASVLMLSAGVASLPVGASITGILWVSGHANPAVVALICAAPTTLILALSRLVARAKDALPPVHHHHYSGTVHQDHRSVNTQTRGLIANTRNELPS